MTTPDNLNDWFWAIGLGLAAAAITAILLPPLIAWLKRRAVLDLPNARSSHTQATPRGGGIAVMTAILVCGAVWLTLFPDIPAGFALVGAAMLALVSWIDDRRRGGLPAGQRLAAQALAIAAVLYMLPADARIAGDWLPTQALPLWIERALVFLAWLWFTNLFNFMDGINGISGAEAVSVGAGLALVQAVAGLVGVNAGLGLIVAGAMAGFLPWNWNRARVFLGDVGSVPVGFLLGWLLLDAAMQGFWAVAVILPLYYWTDATVTLIRRLARGERIWQAHNSHFYQQGARKFGSHAVVASHIAILNLGLILLALVAVLGWPYSGGAVAVAIVATLLLCRHFVGAAKPVE